MDWPSFFESAEGFVLSVGWKVVLLLSIPFLIWKALDTWGKRKKG
jgi:hypothetical protein